MKHNFGKFFFGAMVVTLLGFSPMAFSCGFDSKAPSAEAAAQEGGN